MWSITLSVSKYQLTLFLVLYALITLLLCHLFWWSTVRYCIVILVVIIIAEIRRMVSHVLSMQGALVIINQQHVYWRKQRWHFHYKPLFLPGALWLTLRACYDDHFVTLLLFYDQTDRASWRRLCYLMQLTRLTWDDD